MSLLSSRRFPSQLVLPLQVALLAAAPLSALAIDVTTCTGFVAMLKSIGNFLGGIIFVVAVIVFLIGAFYLLFGGGSEDAQKKGKQYVIYGIAGVVVAALAFSLPYLIPRLLGLSLPPECAL